MSGSGWLGFGFGVGTEGGGWGGVGIDDAARTDLTGVQCRRLLESDDHFTIRLPALLTDITCEMFGKCVRCEISVREDFLVVG